MKGLIYTLEAVLGAVMILLGTTLIFSIQQQASTDVSSIGFYCLKYMDQRGELRYYAVNNLTEELNASLRECLPSVFDFKFRMCPSSDCKEDVPSNRSVYISSYLIAGENLYNKRLVNLWMWSK